MGFLLNNGDEVSDERLGGGAFGDVWLGRDRHSKARVAIKLAVTPSAQVSGTAIDDAFTREELALSRVRHPNVVSLLDSGVYEGRRFLVLEYVRGQSLWTVFHEQQTNPTLAMKEKMRILCEIARALGEVHAKGFVHLDVKPENILVTAEGRVVLIDFGSSLSVDEAHSRPVEIETGAYCAPEQIQGTRWCSGEGLTQRTDVFAFGIVAWEILSLRRPFGDATGGQLQRIANENPEGNLRELAPECPQELANLIGICLSKNPKSRYASMAVVAQRIDNIAALQASLALHRKGQIEAAIQKAEEAIAASPDSQQARDLAFSYCKEHIATLLKKGDLEKAREWLQRARDHCAGSPEGLAYIANLEKENGANIYADRKIRALIERAERDLKDGNARAAAEYIAMAEKAGAAQPLLQEISRSVFAEIEELLRIPNYPDAIARWQDWSHQAQMLKLLPGASAELDRLHKKIWKQAASDVEQALFVHDFVGVRAFVRRLENCCKSDETARDHIQALVKMRQEQEAAYADSIHLNNLELLSEGEYEEALAKVDQALDVLPDDASLLSAKAGLTRSLGEAQDAETSIRSQIEAGAFDRAATLLDQAHQSRKLSTAQLLEFDRWLSREREINSAIQEATLLYADGKCDEAIEILSQLLASYPTDSRAIAAKAELDARIHSDVLSALVASVEQTIDAGGLDNAATMLAEAQSRFPQDQVFLPLQVRLEQAIAREAQKEIASGVEMAGPIAEEDENRRSQPVSPASSVAFRQKVPSQPEPHSAGFGFRHEEKETSAANDNTHTKNSREGRPVLPHHASKSTPVKLRQHTRPVGLAGKQGATNETARSEPLSFAKKITRTFDSAQRYTVIGLAASILLVLLVVGHLFHRPSPAPSHPDEVHVVITSNPLGAAVRVEGGAGAVDCVTPRCTLSLPAGPYSVAATVPNLPPVTQNMEVKSGMGTVEITFPPVPSDTTATLVVQTPGVRNAHVFINGAEFPTAGSELRIPAALKSTYRIRAEKDGYDPSPEQKVTLSHSSETLAIILKPSAVPSAPNRQPEIAINTRPSPPPLATGPATPVYTPPPPQQHPPAVIPKSHPEPAQPASSVIVRPQPTPTVVPPTRSIPEPSRSREQQDRSEIGAVLTAYQQAYDSRNIDQLRSIYPGMPAKEMADTRQSFHLASAIHTELRDQSLNINGDSAQAVCAQSMQVMSLGQKQTLSSNVTFWLSRQSGRWLIQRIQYAKH